MPRETAKSPSRSSKRKPLEAAVSKSIALATATVAPSVGDFYWDYCDILRGAYGVSETLYDQRVLAFLALKVLCDNKKLSFSFDHTRNFDQKLVQADGPKATFLQIVKNLVKFQAEGTYLNQPARLNNPASRSEKVESSLAHFNSAEVFDLTAYVSELDEAHLIKVLDIYRTKANFFGYPKEGYKDLYEQTVWRMKNSGKKSISGQLTGQHFTQKAIIQLMCKACIGKVKKRQKIALYDPACGVGSMLMEAYYCFRSEKPTTEIEVFGQELSPQVWMLAKVFLEVAGIPNQIARGSTLTQPAFANGINGSDSFDFIIANPPFGVDWKHSYDEIVESMRSSESSPFWVVGDAESPVLPRKSDGQFLFIQHIVRLMMSERDKGKSAHAAVVTSSSLLNVGGPNSGEARIRRELFRQGLLSAVLEQPPGMFTNTDIPTHIWFLDTKTRPSATKGTVKIVRAANPADPCYSPHPAPKDKMRNSYDAEDIARLTHELVDPSETLYLSKLVDSSDIDGINISQELKGAPMGSGSSLVSLEQQMRESVRNLAVAIGVLQ